MNLEQSKHCLDNIDAFAKSYRPKYESGQIKHSGNMWTMGAYQALENAEEEALDNWSYLRQIRKTLDEIKEILDDTGVDPELRLEEISRTLNRRKSD